jgi:hypothetical protein
MIILGLSSLPWVHTLMGLEEGLVNNQRLFDGFSSNAVMSIIFNKASSVTDLRLLVFSFSTAPSYDYVLADGVRYSYNASGLSFDSVKQKSLINFQDDNSHFLMAWFRLQ